MLYGKYTPYTHIHYVKFFCLDAINRFTALVYLEVYYYLYLFFLCTGLGLFINMTWISGRFWPY